MTKIAGEGAGKKSETEKEEQQRAAVGGSMRERERVGLQPLAAHRNWSVNSSHWLSL